TFGAIDCGLQRSVRQGRLCLRLGGLALERVKAVPLHEARSGGAVGPGLDAVAVPTPQVAVFRYEPLPDRKLGLNQAALGGIDHADLPEPAGKNVRTLDEFA